MTSPNKDALAGALPAAVAEDAGACVDCCAPNRELLGGLPAGVVEKLRGDGFGAWGVVLPAPRLENSPPLAGAAGADEVEGAKRLGLLCCDAEDAGVVVLPNNELWAFGAKRPPLLGADVCAFVEPAASPDLLTSVPELLLPRLPNDHVLEVPVAGVEVVCCWFPNAPVLVAVVLPKRLGALVACEAVGVEVTGGVAAEEVAVPNLKPDVVPEPPPKTLEPAVVDPKSDGWPWPDVAGVVLLPNADDVGVAEPPKRPPVVPPEEVLPALPKRPPDPDPLVAVLPNKPPPLLVPA